MELSKHIVYKKDSKGHTYTVGETVQNKDIVQHTTILSSLDRILDGAKDFQGRKDDIWIAGFPKSGIHWISEVVNALLGRDMTPPFLEADRILEMTSDIKKMDEMASPRVLNTYTRLKYLPEHCLKGSKAIFVLRNPKSVAVSYFYHYKTFAHYQYDGTFSGFLPTFIEGIDSLYGNWFDMVTGYWKAHKDNPAVLFVSYEDFIKNPVSSVQGVAEFLGLSHDVALCEDVVAKTKFDVMKAMEAPALINNPMITGELGLYRKGIITDWKTHFNDAENEMFDQIYEEKMKDFPELRQKIQFS